jgi:5-methylcytosine-specific restriction endonuclease McrA
VSKKERGLIKGALRRVFSRSDLRRQVVEESRVAHYDPERPRVTKWSLCSECQKLEPTYLVECDHLEPVVPIDKSLEDMTWDELVSRIFCDKSNLVVKCKPCHKLKSKQENKDRREARKKLANSKK